MNFVIIGNGVAGISAAMTIRRREPGARITVISGETEYFFSRTALMYAYMDKMSARELEPYERNVWKKQKIALLRDWVEGLNADNQTILLRSTGAIHYDRLLIATGSTPNRIPWKGMNGATEGVVHFVSMQDLQECERLTKPGAKAVVVGGGLIGVELAECLIHHNVDVTFLVREPWYWPMALGEEEGTMVSGHIRSHGINLLHNELVSEVHTDSSGRVAAVSTESGQRFDCSILGVTAGVRPAIDWLKTVERPPETGRGVVTGPDFATSLPNVWAAGDVAEIHLPGKKPLIEQIWYSARRQGELAGRAMLGDKVAYQPPLFYNKSKFFEIEFTTVGEVVRPRKDSPLECCNPVGALCFAGRVPGKNVCVRIAERDGAVIGFNMLGSRWNHRVLERWVNERRSLDYVMRILEQAQFDVEFGRQDLHAIRTAYRRWRAESGTAAA